MHKIPSVGQYAESVEPPLHSAESAVELGMAALEGIMVESSLPSPAVRAQSVDAFVLRADLLCKIAVSL